MCSSSVQVFSIVALVAFSFPSVRCASNTDLVEKDSSSGRRCFHCIHQEPSSSWAGCEGDIDPPTITCPLAQPYCATIAVSPDFNSTLSCVEKTTESCTLRYSPATDTHTITCVCANDMCNQALSTQAKHELKEYASKGNSANLTDATDLFINNSALYRNISKQELQSTIIVRKFKPNPLKIITNDSNIIDNNKTDGNVISVINANATNNKNGIHSSPIAEALKQEAAAITDDDEDEGEGSGAWREEGRLHKKSPALPAAPSPFLPSLENTAAPLLTNILVTTSFLLYIII